MTDTTRTSLPARELPLAPHGEVEILLTSNELRLRGTDDDRVVIRARGGEALDDRITIDGTPGRVRILDRGGEFRFGPLQLRVRRPPDLDIDVPRTARLNVRTLSGDVDAIGIGGSSRWATASGDLRLNVEGGPVSIESMSGDVTLEATAAVAVTARTMSGDLRLHAPRLDSLSASTASGDMDIEADLAEGTGHTISSISGDVQLATGSAVRLEAQSVTGEIRASVPHRAEGGRGHRTLVVGDGRVPLSIRTMSGDVSLRAASQPVPARPPAADHVAPPVLAPAEPPVVAVASAEPTPGAAGPGDLREAARLDVLRALERGDLDVEAASRRLEALGEAGPRSFRGWS